MSQTNTPMAPPTGPVAAPHGPRERRIRFGHLALAIALIVVGALGTAALVTTVAAGGSYLALAQDVEYGAQITEADLVEVQIASPPALEAVPASSRSHVLQLYAAIPLVKGSLLNPNQLTNKPPPGPNQRVVGLTLRRERLPAELPSAGHEITLVASEDSNSNDEAPGAPRTFPATVTGVSGDESDSLFQSSSRTVTIDVAVSTTDAPTVAVLAADDRISIVLGGS